MAKKSAKPKFVEPEFESQDFPEEEAEITHAEPASGKGISKADAVREALAQGKEGPEEGTDYIRSQYGIEMTRQTFSSYKAQEKARSAKKQAASKPGRKPKAEAPVAAVAAPKAAPVPHATATNGEADLINSLETLKPLIASMGADRVKRLVDLLG